MSEVVKNLAAVPGTACVEPQSARFLFGANRAVGTTILPVFKKLWCPITHVTNHAAHSSSQLDFSYTQYSPQGAPVGVNGPWLCTLTYMPHWKVAGLGNSDKATAEMPIPPIRVMRAAATKDAAKRECCASLAPYLPELAPQVAAPEPIKPDDVTVAAVGLVAMSRGPGGPQRPQVTIPKGMRYSMSTHKSLFGLRFKVDITIEHEGEGRFKLVGIELNPGPDGVAPAASLSSDDADGGPQEYQFALPDTAVVAEFPSGVLIMMPKFDEIPFWRIDGDYRHIDVEGGTFYYHREAGVTVLTGMLAALALHARPAERHNGEGNTDLVGVELNPGPKNGVSADFIGPLRKNEVKRAKPKPVVKPSGKVVVKPGKPKVTVMSFVIPKAGTRPVVVKAWVHDVTIDGDVEKNPGPFDAVSTLYTPPPSLMLSGDIEPNPGPESVEQMIEPTQPTRARAEYKKAVRDMKFASRHDGLTRGGNEVTFQLLDAFHDTDINAQDFPTGVNGKVIIEAVTRQVTISKPPTLPAGASWDLHVTTNGFAGGTNNIAGFDPALGTSGVNCGAFMDIVGINATTVGQNFGPVGAPVLMHRVSSGTDTFTGVINTGDIGAIDVPPEYLKGPCRLVGIGVELVNTTAPLYKNGSVTVYRLPANYKEFTAQVGLVESAGARVYVGAADVGASTAAINVDTSMRIVAGAYPPTKLGDAALAQNAAMWNASEGVYLQGLYERIPDMEPCTPVLPAWFNDDADVGVATARVTTPWPTMNYSPGAVQRRVAATSPSIGTSNLGAGIVNNFQWDALAPKLIQVPIARSGAYFAGLHESTTFTMRVRFYIARVPSINEGQLYVLARKAVPYDEEFWRLYTQACSALPPGCMFTENPLGEWFNKVLKIVRDYAPIAGHALGTVVPGAALVGKGVGMAAGAVKDMYKAQKKKKNKT